MATSMPMSDASNGVAASSKRTTVGGSADSQADQAAQGAQEQAAQASAQEEDAKSNAELEQAPTQGGGAKAQALVPAGRGTKPKTYTVTTNQSTGQVYKITFHQACGDKVLKRPAATDPHFLLWNFAATQYTLARRGLRDRALVTRLHNMLNLARPSSETRRSHTGNAGATNSSDPWTWETRELPLNTKDIISTTYHLAFEEDICLPDGRLFVPNGKRASQCGCFPHMIENHRPRGAGKHGTANSAYVVGASHLINMKVKLVKTLEDGSIAHASETEVLEKIKEQFNTVAWSKLGHYEHRITLYVWMEIADGPHEGTRVQSNMFKKELPNDAVFRPKEGPPYKGNPACEKEMQGGWAKFDKMHINAKMTTANLNNRYKDCRMRMVVSTLNPFLNDLVGFTARSVPFYPKAVLHNAAHSNECYVEGPDGTPIAVDRTG